MAHGQIRRIDTPKAAGSFIEYKIQPGDKNLKQIAREQLADETLWDKIILHRETPNPKGFFWDEVPANAFDHRWTILLPPSEFAAVTITVNTTICDAPNGNLLDAAKTGEKYFYKRSNVKVDGQNVWAEVTKTNPGRYGGKPYWICVKKGNPTTHPAILAPS